MLAKPIHLATTRLCIFLLAIGCSRAPGPQTPGERLGRSESSLLVNTAANQIGRTTSTGNGDNRIYNQYDALGRAVHVQHVLNQVSYVFATAYGYPQTAVGLCAGNVCGGGGALGTVPVSAVFSDGEQVRYTYDAAGAQQSVIATPCTDSPPPTNGTCSNPGASQSIVGAIARNARGQTVKVVLGDGTEQDHCYNDGASCIGTPQPNTDLRLNRIRSINEASGTVLQDYIYGFDAVGNVTGLADGMTPSLSATYTYDSLNRLTSMSSNGATSSYGYDSIHNLTTKEGGTQQFGLSGYGPHQLAIAAGLTYHYDANGNVISRSDGLSIAWNAENMPVQVTGGAASEATTKSFVGESLWKKVQGTTTTLYLPSVRVENGVFHKYFGAFAERDVDGTLKFYHPDHLGSSVLVTDSAANVVHRAAYLPYGGDRSVVNYTPAYTERFTPEYQFEFKEKEKDGTGFYDFGARLYNPATGRWMSADTSTSDGPNRYAFVRDNPLAYIDPTGHGSEVAWEVLNYTGKVAGFVTGIDSRTAVNLFHAENTADRIEAVLKTGAGIANTFATALSFGGYGAARVVVQKAVVTEAENTARVVVEQKVTQVAERQVAKVVESAGLCFAAGTLVDTAGGERRIEDLRVGDRVRTSDDDGSGATEVEPETWRDIRLAMPNPDGSGDVIDIEILRPLTWIVEVGASTGRWIGFGLPEMGLSGEALVTSVSATPPIQAGPGHVVRARVAHLNSQLHVLTFREVRDVLQPTATHRLYSVDRQSWVPVADLREGERLSAEAGPITIESNTRKGTTEQVYNIEVETEHSYLVGPARILSHNVNPCAAVLSRKAFGETSIKGLVQNQPLRELTDTAVREAFEGTPFKLSNHAIKRLLELRTKAAGVETLNDVARVLNQGVVEPAGNGLVQVVRDGFAAIINPKTNVIVTFTPH